MLPPIAKQIGAHTAPPKVGGNGMAESFVKTIKHDYIAFMHKPDVPTALSHLAGAFEHYNERHPHKALKYRPPREFRRTAASST